ncbi:MAG: choice-of-anchor D domain-containing protein [Bacteroidaceae bacterium]|nr:choice-of-anchor D domain-containing protein [Bacteroidaceae bacterium]
MYHLRQYIIPLLCLISLSGRAQAGALISLTTASGHPGDEVEVTVSISGAEGATAIQLQIPLSSSLAFVEGSAALDRSLATESHSLSTSQSNGILKLYVYSLSLETFKAAAGPLLSFRLKLGKEPNTYLLTPEAVISRPDGSALETTVSSGDITVLSPKIQLSAKAIHFGSVPIRSTYQQPLLVANVGNEPLAITDIVSPNSLFSVNPSTLTLPAGGQQSITISYAPTQYGSDSGTIFINSNAVNGTQRVSVDASPYSVNILSLADVSGHSDEEVTLHVNLQNMESIVAAQCRISLPEGVTYVEESAQISGARSSGHQISAHTSDGWTDFYLHSSSNSAFQGSDGELFTFRLKLGTTGGTYPLGLSNVLLSNVDGRDMTSSTVDASLRIAAPRLQCDAALDFGEVPMEEIATRSFTIHNTGELPLSIQRIEFSNPAFHLQENNELSAIEAGEACDITICFDPDGEQQVEATMQLYSNDPDNRMSVVRLNACSYPTNQLLLDGAPSDDQTESYILDINLKNSSPIVAIQFDIHWIEGMATASGLITLSQRAKDHQVALSRVDDTTFRVFVYSTENAAIAPSDGSLLSIIYNKVSSDVDYNLSTIRVDNVILSTLEEQNRASSATDSLLVCALMGDANGDGSVSVTDVVCIVDYLLQRQPSPFIREQADVNQDGEISISDIVEVIHLIMQQKN